jgi:hypothetical protein
VNFWRDNPVFRGIVYALGAMALIAFFVRMRNPSAAAPENDQPSVAVSPSPVTNPIVPPHVNSLEMLARCQPELKEAPSAPTF